MLWGKIEIRQKTIQKELPNVIHPQKFPELGNTGGTVLLSAKFETLFCKNDSTKGVFLENFRQFPEHLGIIDFWY